MSRAQMYTGARLSDMPRDTRVLADGEPLHHVVWHSPDGFEFSYSGSGPADLALSILADYFGERPTRDEISRGDCQCWTPHQEFKRDFIAAADRTWVITREQIDVWLQMWRAEHTEEQQL